MKAPIVFEKVYYSPTYFDNSRRRTSGKETGDWSGVVLTYRFLIKSYINGYHLKIEPDLIEFRGSNKDEMVRELTKATDQIEEWTELGELNYKYAKLFPPEVEKKLKEYKIQYRRQ